MNVNSSNFECVSIWVFGRKNDFDQNTDPIVSIQVNKLRQTFERYYLTTGNNDPIHINTPKGSYVPIFNERMGVESTWTVRGEENPLSRLESARPKIVIRRFQNFTENTDPYYLTVGFTTELVMEISRYQGVRIRM